VWSFGTADSDAGVLSTKVDKIAPTSERQVRPLAPLARNDPKAAAEHSPVNI
jgi:hypothetical protein